MKNLVINRKVVHAAGMLVVSLLVLPGMVSGVPALADECVAVTKGLESMQPGMISLRNDRDENLELEVLVADDNFERASGFQHICADVIDQVFILFEYSAAFPGRFHMQNVHAPLDIAFFDEQGHVVATRLMNTYTETSHPLYGPGVPFQFALEARAGFFAEHHISAQQSQLLLGSLDDK